MPDASYPWRLVKLAKLNGIAEQQAYCNRPFYLLADKQEPYDEINHQPPQNITYK